MQRISRRLGEARLIHNSVDRHSRSLVRRIPSQGAHRKRYLAVRLAVAVMVIVALGALVAAIANQSFDPDRIGYILYFLHDEVYLPLRGSLWVRSFPASLIWFLPLCAIVTLTLLEVLSPAGLRPLQRLVTLAMISRGLLWLFPGRLRTHSLDPKRWDRDLSGTDHPAPVIGGFALRVALERFSADWARIREMDNPTKASLRRAETSLALALQIDPYRPRTLLATLECAMVLPGHPAADRVAARLQSRIDRLGSDSASGRVGPISDALAARKLVAERERSAAVDAIEIRLKRLQQDNSKPIALAADAVVVAALCRAHKLSAGTAYFELWSARHLTPSAISVAMAERLVDLEYWAFVAESNAEDMPVDPLLHDALPGFATTAGISERFAWSGVP